jgi:hypothetical protein
VTSPYPYAQPPAAYPPQQPGYAPPQQYAPPPAAYQQPGYAPPQQYAPPAPPPTARGTIDMFYNQPGGGSGKPLSFTGKPPGTTYRGIVARPVTDADIRQQTDRNQVPLTHKDGRPKFVMVVPLIVAQGPEFPEGMASWWVKGQPRDELSRAMAAAGAPEGAPEAGAVIDITFTGERQIPGFNAQRIFAISYQRPQANGQAPAPPAPQAQPQWPAPGAPLSVPPAPAPPGENPYQQPQGQYPQQGQAPAQPQYQPPMQPQGQYPQQGQPPMQPQGQYPQQGASPSVSQPGYGGQPQGYPSQAPQQPQGQYPQQGQAPQQPQGPAPAAPGQVPGLDPAQQALLARLQAGQAPQQQG